MVQCCLYVCICHQILGTLSVLRIILPLVPTLLLCVKIVMLLNTSLLVILIVILGHGFTLAFRILLLRITCVCLTISDCLVYQHIVTTLALLVRGLITCYVLQLLMAELFTSADHNVVYVSVCLSDNQTCNLAHVDLLMNADHTRTTRLV